MIDIHCHILPGLDDGAATMQEALMMAAMAADDGVRAIVATPHVTWDKDPLDEKLSAIRSTTEVFREELRSAGIPIRLYVGAEVLCVDTTSRIPSVKTFPRIGGTRYSLVEFLFQERAEQIEKHLVTLREVGIFPIIAHPERYKAVQKDKALLDHWIREGFLLQVNKGSLRGQFGYHAKKVAIRMMKEHLAAFIATDAHSSTNRTPRMRSTCLELAETYGKEYLLRIAYKNPSMLLGENRSEVEQRKPVHTMERNP